MSQNKYTRKYLAQYGVTDADQFVCEWISDDRQSSIVAGLGETEREARDDAQASADRGEFEIDGGSLSVSEIGE